METPIRVSFKLARLMAEELIAGRLTVQVILVNSRMVSSMAGGNGEAGLQLFLMGLSTIMRENMNSTRSMEMEYLRGPVEMYTKENIRMTKDMVKGRWCGLMARGTSESGVTGYSMAKGR